MLGQAPLGRPKAGPWTRSGDACGRGEAALAVGRGYAEFHGPEIRPIGISLVRRKPAAGCHA
jgi:hypothetical protein